MIAHPYTKDYQSRALVLTTKCQVAEDYEPMVEEANPFTMPLNAIWDTGSQRTVLSAKVAKQLGLISLGQVMMQHANGTTPAETYLVNLILPNGMEIPHLYVMEGYIGDTDVLLGMDVITLGDLCITEPNGETRLSFQTPSTHKTDYRIEQP